jgi:hypothetical protein
MTPTPTPAGYQVLVTAYGVTRVNRWHYSRNFQQRI